MGLPKNQVDGARLAGMIHDLGKISVPADILSKPSRLTENEFDLVKTHPEVGYDILKGIEFPWPIAQITLQHHERMDGSGYPQGLSREDILVEAKILAVADVVEAMVSHRPYRPAFPLDNALKEIAQRRGTLYDADVVDACLTVFGEHGFKFRQF
jgi:HD-GYP domain-containing protein (c-di-GMP phosphodiesterase class II)